MKALVIVVLLCGSVAAQTAGLASVRVYKYGGRNNAAKNNDTVPDSTGSGWLITDSQVVTAYHVIHNNRGGDKAVLVRFVDGYKTHGVVEAVSVEHDLALIWINPHQTIRSIPRGEIPEMGKDVTIHGFGFDYEYRTHTGALSSRMRTKVRNYGTGSGTCGIDAEGPWQVVFTAAIPGDSGGPVTYNGQVIGSVLSTASSLSIFCRIDTIEETFKDKLQHMRIK